MDVSTERVLCVLYSRALCCCLLAACTTEAMITITVGTSKTVVHKSKPLLSSSHRG